MGEAQGELDLQIICIISSYIILPPNLISCIFEDGWRQFNINICSLPDLDGLDLRCYDKRMYMYVRKIQFVSCMEFCIPIPGSLGYLIIPYTSSMSFRACEDRMLSERSPC